MALQFAKDGYSNIAVSAAVSALLCTAAFFVTDWLAYILFFAAALLMAFILFFFRDPDRDIPAGKDLLLSPADGKIVFLKEVDEPTYIGGKAIQISIFLSPLNVHVNRLPVSGKLEYVKYNPGVYLMAWDHRASSMNERADFGILHPTGTKVFFRQITGFMARRIVYHLTEGQHVKAGERFGMMKFGSRMDILVPPNVQLNVKEGDSAVAGETILGSL